MVIAHCGEIICGAKHNPNNDDYSDATMIIAMPQFIINQLGIEQYILKGVKEMESPFVMDSPGQGLGGCHIRAWVQMDDGRWACGGWGWGEGSIACAHVSVMGWYTLWVGTHKGHAVLRGGREGGCNI